ncbi:hypothetical protein D3C72_2234800 [compost metagenome]
MCARAQQADDRTGCDIPCPFDTGAPGVVQVEIDIQCARRSIDVPHGVDAGSKRSPAFRPDQPAVVAELRPFGVRLAARLEQQTTVDLVGYVIVSEVVP